MAGPLVSVVTPFYNTVAYLDECIRSVLAQTLMDFEYILVDNCSTDGSTEIARSWAARDSRIRLAQQPSFVGQVENYNSALSQISPSSTYVKVVQADDTIMPVCLERMVAVASRDDDVAVVGSSFLYGKAVLFTEVPGGVAIQDGSAVCRHQLLSRGFLAGNPTTLLYRASLVRARTPFFTPGRFHEDTEACFELLLAHKFGFAPEVLSFVRIDNVEGSQSGRREDFDWFLALRYTMIRRYGATLLTPRELASAESWVTVRYAWRLVRAAIAMRGREYFAFHRSRLAEVGERLTLLTPVAWVLRAGTRMLFGARAPSAGAGA